MLPSAASTMRTLGTAPPRRLSRLTPEVDACTLRRFPHLRPRIQQAVRNVALNRPLLQPSCCADVPRRRHQGVAGIHHRLRDRASPPDFTFKVRHAALKIEDPPLELAHQGVELALARHGLPASRRARP